MFIPSVVIIASTIPTLSSDIGYIDYNKFPHEQVCIIKNKPVLEYNTINTEEYNKILLEKTMFLPLILELEKDIVPLEPEP